VKIMYVCVCHSVTDREICEAVERGAGSLYEVQCELPVAASCGRCAEFACSLVEEHLQRLGAREKKVA
jgi:bacterioferritin-associated ferredoxin